MVRTIAESAELQGDERVHLNEEMMQGLQISPEMLAEIQASPDKFVMLRMTETVNTLDEMDALMRSCTASTDPAFILNRINHMAQIMRTATDNREDEISAIVEELITTFVIPHTGESVYDSPAHVTQARLGELRNSIYVYESRDLQDERCIICQEKIKDGDACIRLGCGHMFHPLPTDGCLGLITWLLKSDICPLCREKV